MKPSLLSIVIGLSLLASAMGAAAQQFGSQAGMQNNAGGEIGVADGRGSFYSASNRSGYASYFQLTKLSSNGGVVWNAEYAPGVDVAATVMTVDADGGPIVAGTSKNGSVRDLLVVKFTPSGSQQWRVTYPGGGNTIPSAIATNHEGKVFIASTIAEPGGSHVRILSLNDSGGVLWSQVIRLETSNYARTMLVDFNGAVTVLIVTANSNGASGFFQTKQVLVSPNGSFRVIQ